MPELPDVAVYVEAVARKIVGHRLDRLQLLSPFVLRSVAPPVAELEGLYGATVERMGKRIVLGLRPKPTGRQKPTHFAVIHLMVAGRLQWLEPDKKLNRKRTLLAAHFSHPKTGPTGMLQLTEAGTKKRASLYLVAGRPGLAEHDRGGRDVFSISASEFAAALREENHTLKRSLTDPRILDGIGNAYSDEILLRARLSPVAMTKKLSDEQFETLHRACREVLSEWVARLRQEAGEGFPAKVTAFRPEMGAHGKYGDPCPQCGTPIQRIVYASRETNYCPGCQTGGKLLADRSLSRLLKKDWPRSLEEMEAHRAARRKPT